MDSQPLYDDQKLHIAVLPFTKARSHMIPSMDMARLFARHGLKSTILTTPLDSPFFSKTIEKDQKLLGLEIAIQLIEFPQEDSLLTGLQQCQPDVLVADMMFPWATEIARKFGIPRLIFHGTGCFPLCVWDYLRRYKPYKTLESDFEPFTIPSLPDVITLTRSMLPSYFRNPTNGGEFMARVYKSEEESYGIVFNSFLGLEPAYVEHYNNKMRRKSWHIGPFFLSNMDKAQKGNEKSIDEHECLKWLESKEPESVLFICFGSMITFSAPQLLELAMALEASGRSFIWVVKKDEEEEQKGRRLLEGFEARTKGLGLIIRGWAPQRAILDHEAIGGFMTHCGWNSMVEAVASGVPMVTWPCFAEQFFNERMIVDVLKVGVSVGAQEFSGERKILIKKDEIEKAIRCLMVEKEGERMRNIAKELQEMARKAIEEGGSSHSSMVSLIEELKNFKMSK